MISFKGKAFGVLAVIGLFVTADCGYELWKVNFLKNHGVSLSGTVIECIPYNEKTKSRGNERLKMLIRYNGCKGATDFRFVAFRKYQLPEHGSIELLSDGKCPETVILRDAPNNAWKAGIVGVMILFAGSAGIISGFARDS